MHMHSLGFFFGQNWLFLLLILVAVTIYGVYVAPWLWENGHPAMAISGFAFFGVVAMYGRANTARKRKLLARREE